MNELRDDIATARASHVKMVARCNDMLARLDSLEGSEAAEIRAEVLTIAGKLENLTYWLGCLEWREEAIERMCGWAARGRGSLH
jgi:hypothetical protein